MSKEEEMAKLVELIENCRRCSLWRSRTNPVPGEGSLNAEVLFIGEAPGYNEDKQGKPFVGRAGRILSELLASINLTRSEVYIANILKCRPPGNRDPDPEEISACTEYLDKQIEIIQPRIISPLGKFACGYIFKKYGIPYDKISNHHGKVYRVSTLMGMITIIPLYHPAVATYNPRVKTMLFEDIKKIASLLTQQKQIG